MEQNKTFKYGEDVYVIAEVSHYGNLTITKGKVAGVFEHSSIHKFLYCIETPKCYVYRFPCNIYHTFEELLDDLKNHVIE